MSDGVVSFAADIKPLFRIDDRRSMIDTFDLWDLASVRAHSAEILDRLEDGSMPCDGPWSDGQVALLRRWVLAGCPE